MRRKSIILIVGLVVFVGSALFLWSRGKASTPKFLTTPAPAYETLVQASRALGDNRGDQGTNELAEYVEANAPAMKMVREALTQKFEAPMAAYDVATMGNIMPELGSFKSLALALRNEGVYRETQTNYSQAAETYVDVIRLGSKVESGTIIFALVGIAIERIGIDALERIEHEIQAPVRQQIAAKLREINSQRIPFAGIAERERVVLRRNAPTPIHVLILSRFNRAGISKAESKYEQAWQALDALASKLEQPAK